jgi:hypothetical protein
MTGDDHANGGTAGRFDAYKAQSPAGCSVVNWECIRSTSYLYPSSFMTDAQAADYTAAGFELAAHGLHRLHELDKCDVAHQFLCERSEWV